jgi:toxin YoeB
MHIVFTRNAWAGYEYWLENDVSIALKIKDLLKDISHSPFKGLGKPEPLRHEFKGFWSRRITQEHRLVYRIVGKKGVDQRCEIIQCQFHY